MARALAAIQRNVIRSLRREARETPKGLRANTKVLSDVPNDTFFWNEQKQVFLNEIGEQPFELMAEGALQAEQLGLAINFDLVNQEVLDFSGSFTNEWWGRLSGTTQDSMRTAISSHIASGAPLSTLEGNLAGLFGKNRAQTIASTEVTRMFAEGNRRAYRSAGVTTVEFQTVRDSRVDPICDALHKRELDVNDKSNFPPLHPRCRCWIAPIVCRETGTRDKFGEKQAVCEALTAADAGEPENFVNDVADNAIFRGSYGEISRRSRELGRTLLARWKNSPEFVKMSKAARRFGSASSPIREASRALLQGRVANVAQAAKDAAATLARHVRTAPIQERSLWRGVHFGKRTTIEELRASWQVGSTVDIPITSASYGKDVAVSFSRNMKRTGFKGKQVMMEFRDTQGLPIGAFSNHPAELEVLIGGRFEVLKVGRGATGDVLNIVLKQVASLP